MKSLTQKLNEARERVDKAKEALQSIRKAVRRSENPPITIGGVIQQIRESKELSVRELSRKACVGFGMLYGLETQTKHNPTFNNLQRIAAGLGMPLSEILSQLERNRESQTVRRNSRTRLRSDPQGSNGALHADDEDQDQATDT